MDLVCWTFSLDLQPLNLSFVFYSFSPRHWQVAKSNNTSSSLAVSQLSCEGFSLRITKTNGICFSCPYSPVCGPSQATGQSSTSLHIASRPPAHCLPPLSQGSIPRLETRRFQSWALLTFIQQVAAAVLARQSWLLTQPWEALQVPKATRVSAVFEGRGTVYKRPRYRHPITQGSQRQPGQRRSGTACRSVDPVAEPHTHSRRPHRFPQWISHVLPYGGKSLQSHCSTDD